MVDLLKKLLQAVVRGGHVSLHAGISTLQHNTHLSCFLQLAFQIFVVLNPHQLLRCCQVCEVALRDYIMMQCEITHITGIGISFLDCNFCVQ